MPSRTSAATIHARAAATRNSRSATAPEPSLCVKGLRSGSPLCNPKPGPSLTAAHTARERLDPGKNNPRQTLAPRLLPL